MLKNDFVEFCQNESCFITEELIDELEHKAINHPLKKYRYCLHQNPESSLHEMIIVTTKYDMKYPDKHLYTTESNIILRGKLLVVFFDEKGVIEDAFVLDPDNIFYYRCEKNKYHMTIPLTDIAVYIEIKEGPFDEKSNEFPDWAPDRNDAEKMRAFNENVRIHATQFLL